MSNKLIRVEITDLAFDGKAVGHIDGKVCFLNGGLPGETVEAEIIRNKPRYYNARVTSILKKSDRRIEPACKHFEICGGCTWQDLTYEDQLKFKQKQVTDCLERLGKFDDIEVADILPSENIFNYRNKMEYSFNRVGDDFTLGLHHRGSFQDIFNLDECHISDPLDGELVRWMITYVHDNDLTVYDVKNHGGYMRFFMLRRTKHTSQLMVNIVTNYGDFPDSEKLIDEITKAFPAITTIVHNENGQKSNIAAGEKETILFGPGYIEEKCLGKTFRISSNSFFQTNSLQAERLYQTGFDLLKPNKGDSVLDLYCGTGTIGILLAPQVKTVTGVELVADAVQAARKNAELNETENITFFEGNVKDFLKENREMIEAYNTVIIDPPRAGLHPKALKELLKINPENILYISCNPSTFARDARTIVDSGYEVSIVKPVDMFPHTMHIELTAKFTKL